MGLHPAVTFANATLKPLQITSVQHVHVVGLPQSHPLHRRLLGVYALAPDVSEARPIYLKIWDGKPTVLFFSTTRKQWRFSKATDVKASFARHYDAEAETPWHTRGPWSVYDGDTYQEEPHLRVCAGIEEHLLDCAMHAQPPLKDVQECIKTVNSLSTTSDVYKNPSHPSNIDSCMPDFMPPKRSCKRNSPYSACLQKKRLRSLLNTSPHHSDTSMTALMVEKAAALCC